MQKSVIQNCKVGKTYPTACEAGKLCDPEASSFYDICTICNKKEYEQIRYH